MKNESKKELEIFLNGNVENIMEHYGIDDFNIIKDLFTLYNIFIEDVFVESFCNNIDNLENIANKYIDIKTLAKYLKNLDAKLYKNNKSSILESLEYYEQFSSYEPMFYYNTYMVFSGLEYNFDHTHFWEDIILLVLETWS